MRKLYKDLYGNERQNSKGLDLTNINHLTPFKANLDNWVSANLVTHSEVPEGHEAVINPANHSEVIGAIRHQDEDEMSRLIELASAAFDAWSQTPVKQRADILRRTAGSLSNTATS